MLNLCTRILNDNVRIKWFEEFESWCLNCISLTSSHRPACGSKHCSLIKNTVMVHQFEYNYYNCIILLTIQELGAMIVAKE